MADISPYRIESVMSEVSKILADMPDDDMKLRYDTLEGETRFFALLDDVAELAIADAKLVELARERIKRIETRIEVNRDKVQRLLQAAGIEGAERPLYTASVAYRSKAIVTDAGRLPPELLRTSPDMLAIAKALRSGPVEGAEQSNLTPVLTLRSA